MTIKDLNEYLLVNSFQYFIGEKDIEVTDKVLTQLVVRALKVYGNYRPLYIQTPQIYVAPYSHPLKEYDGRRVLNITALYLFEPILAGNDGKVTYDWDYIRDTGILRMAVGGSYYLEMMVMPNLEDIGFDQYEFLDLVQGLYLQYIGSSRKGFTLGDLPFENDGAELYQAGDELYKETLVQLSETNDNWYLAIL